MKCKIPRAPPAPPSPGFLAPWLLGVPLAPAARARYTIRMRLPTTAAAFLLLLSSLASPAQILDKQKLLDAQTFWDNRDWDWYRASIPLLETPDKDLDTTYYYRWELVTTHIVYGSPASGDN